MSKPREKSRKITAERNRKSLEEAASALESLMGAPGADGPGSAVAPGIAEAPAEVASVEAAAEALVPEATEEATQDRLESIIESLLFAADRPLTAGEIRRAVGARSDRSIRDVVAHLAERRAATGLQVVQVAGAYRLQTNPENQRWVQKLVAGRPVRLSRAMLETLSIVAYRQPVTRPEIDAIRGVDCGPVLKTLLDRQLIRVIGKKEEVGRPMLYGTTPEFLTTFNLGELVELPTLRDFHELGEDDQALVEAAHGASAGPFAAAPEGAPSIERPVAMAAASPDEEENDSLLDQLEDATSVATRALAAAGKDVDAEGMAASGQDAGVDAGGDAGDHPHVES